MLLNPTFQGIALTGAEDCKTKQPKKQKYIEKDITVAKPNLLLASNNFQKIASKLKINSGLPDLNLNSKVHIFLLDFICLDIQEERVHEKYNGLHFDQKNHNGVNGWGVNEIGRRSRISE